MGGRLFVIPGERNPHGRREPSWTVVVQCSATSKQSGEQCKRSAVPGRNVCNIHGGKTPVGVALPQFQHGRYSRYLPERLLERYEQSRSDPDILAFRDELALTDARLLELIQRLGTGESGNLWLLLDSQYRDLMALWDEGDTDGIGQALTRLGRLIQQGATERSQWGEINEAIEQRRRIAESERRRLVDLQQSITAERAMVMISIILQTIRRHVVDRATLSAISDDLRALTVADPR